MNLSKNSSVKAQIFPALTYVWLWFCIPDSLSQMKKAVRLHGPSIQVSLMPIRTKMHSSTVGSRHQ